MTNCDFLLELSAFDLRELAEDAAERVERARVPHEKSKALRWHTCIFWALILANDGVTEHVARAFNGARKSFLSC